MEWEAIYKVHWRPFCHTQKTYDLSHLHPQSVVYTQPAKGERPECQYTVYVRYSLHCFTRGLRVGEAPDPDLLYTHDRDTRVFDFQRWELSHYLPGIIQALPQRKCYHTGKGNFFTIEVIDQLGNKVDYEVFFDTYLGRTAKKAVLNLFVQSAYVRDWAHSNRPHTKPIGFNIILYNVLHGKEIKVPK